MPKAGKYDYPFFDIDHCIARLRDYFTVVKTDETKREIVAETLGMSMTGGGFAYLMSAMEKYGLIKTGGGNVVITKLGKLSLYGEPSEVTAIKKKAVSNINLFRELYEHYGKDVQLEQTRAFLRQKANVDIYKAQKIAEKLNKIYKNVANYIIPTKKLAPPSESDSQIPSFGRRGSKTEIGKEPLKIQKGGLYIEIPTDANILDNIEYAKDFLTFMENKLSKEQNEDRAQSKIQGK